ncbi:sulfatase [Candidatus Altiarchaeota archaeon]
MSSVGRPVIVFAIVILAGFALLSYSLYSSLNKGYEGPLKVVPSDPSVPSCSDCNVVLVTVEATRADHLDLYGYHRRTMPLLAGYARDGVVFDRAYSQAPWTKPSMASLHTSLYSFRHGAVFGLYDSYMEDSAVTLAEKLSGAGLKTAGFVTISNVKSDFGFSQGFDHFDETNVFDRRAMIVNGEVKKWLSDNRGERFFLWVHYLDPHDPYMPPLTFNIYWNKSYAGDVKPHSELRGLEMKKCMGNLSCRLDYSPADIQHMKDFYHGELRYTDFAIDDLFSHISGLGISNKTMVILTSDHGQEFMDHDLMGHGSSLYDEQVHVPLIVWAPGLEPGRVSRLTGLIDIYPTILSFVGSKVPEGIDGRDLFGSGHDFLITENYLPPRAKKALITEDYKLILSTYPDGNNVTELYPTGRDPSESADLSLEMPDKAAKMTALLDSVVTEVGANQSSREVDDETLRHLQSLGYIL